MKTLRTLITVDFDFFVRELPEWDWGHAETGLHLNWLWAVRYASLNFDLERETEPNEHADFRPEDLDRRLAKLVGWRWPSTFRELPMASAESHALIMRFAEHMPPRAPDLVLNIDAHHDAFGRVKPGLEPTCGNWISKLHEDWPRTKFAWVIPRWQPAKGLYGKPSVPMQLIHGWDTLQEEYGGRVDPIGLFICRSGCWVPPHLDPRFNAMVGAFSPKLKIEKRKIDRAAVAEMRKFTEEAMARHRASTGGVK